MVIGQNIMICRFTFAPFVVTPDIRTRRQATLVMKGKVKFTISGKERIVKAGDRVAFPLEQSSWRNYARRRGRPD